MSHQKSYHNGTSSMDFSLSRHHRAASASFNPQALDAESPAHMRFSSISSKGSASDLSLLQTPQDTQNLQDSVIKPRVDTASKLAGSVAPWQINTNNSTITSDVLTASPTDERPLSALKLKDKPVPSQIVTSFPNRPRPPPTTAHPGQRAVFAPFTAGPRSASAVFVTTPTAESPTQDQPVAQPEPVEPAPLSSQHRRTQSAPLNATPAGLQLEQQMQQQQQQHQQQHQQQQQQHQQQQQQPLNQQYSINFMQSHMMARPEPTVLQAPYAPIPSPAMNGVPRHATMPQLSSPRVYSPPAYNTMPPYTAVNFMPGPMAAMQPMMYSSYFPPTATQAFYSPPPMPPKEPSPPQPTAAAAPASALANNQSPWKAINPNSQPQMPLSWLISQANGGLMVGGPSPHNRKAGLFKSELCRNWEEKRTCRYGLKCQFAHGDDELRRIPRHPKYKTEICRTFWVTGTCPYGKRCCFIHTDTTPATTPTTSNPPAAVPVNGPSFAKGTNNDEENVSQTVSLLARLDLKQRATPDRGSTPSSASALTRKTPDTDVSDPFSFVYPGSAKAVAATGA